MFSSKPLSFTNDCVALLCVRMGSTSFQILVHSEIIRALWHLVITSFRSGLSFIAVDNLGRTFYVASVFVVLFHYVPTEFNGSNGRNDCGAERCFTCEWLHHIHPATLLCGACCCGGCGVTVMNVLATIETAVYHQHLARTTSQSGVLAGTHNGSPGLCGEKNSTKWSRASESVCNDCAVLCFHCESGYVPSWHMKLSSLSQSLVASHWKPECFSMCPQAAPGCGLLAQFEKVTCESSNQERGAEDGGWTHLCVI